MTCFAPNIWKAPSKAETVGKKIRFPAQKAGGICDPETAEVAFCWSLLL